MSIIPVILSGGSGTRLWPVSRESSQNAENIYKYLVVKNLYACFCSQTI